MLSVLLDATQMRMASHIEIYRADAGVELACMPRLQFIKAWIDDKVRAVFSHAQGRIEPKRRRSLLLKESFARSRQQLHVVNRSML